MGVSSSSCRSSGAGCGVTSCSKVKLAAVTCCCQGRGAVPRHIAILSFQVWYTHVSCTACLSGGQVPVSCSSLGIAPAEAQGMTAHLDADQYLLHCDGWLPALILQSKKIRTSAAAQTWLYALASQHAHGLSSGAIVERHRHNHHSWTTGVTHLVEDA